METGGNAKGTLLDEKLRQVLGQYYAPFMLMNQVQMMGRIQARLPYVIINN